MERRKLETCGHAIKNKPQVCPYRAFHFEDKNIHCNCCKDCTRVCKLSIDASNK